MTKEKAMMNAKQWSERVNLPAYIYKMANGQWYVAYSKSIAAMKSKTMEEV